MRGLDLFCKQGGATRGYQMAGFEMTGVDIEAQPRYCGEHFVQADALEYLRTSDLGEFDFIHASPPCQRYTSLHGLTMKFYPALVEAVREALRAAGRPYVIENVVGAPLMEPVQLCGSSFGLRVWRHRRFETSFPIGLVPPCSHKEFPRPLDVTGTGGPSNKPRVKPGGGVSRKPKNTAEAGAAMGIDWMDRRGLSQAIPPIFAYTIATHLLAALEHA